MTFFFKERFVVIVAVCFGLILEVWHYVLGVPSLFWSQETSSALISFKGLYSRGHYYTAVAAARGPRKI